MAKSVNKKRSVVSSDQQPGVSSVTEQPTSMTKKIALSGWPMIIGWLAMLIFTFHACTRMVAAGDTWVAMACGRHFVNHGVDTVEPFSANSHKAGPTEQEIQTWPNWARWITNKVGIKTVKKLHPTGWVDQNWLTHVIFYKLVPEDSYDDGVSFTSNALVYWKFTIYIITVICVYYTSRLLGVNPALAAVFACFAMFAGRSFLDVRPAGFSNMLVAVFILVLALTTYRNVWYIWLVVPVAVFWCNVHGGYIYVFIMLVPFFVMHLLTALPRRWTVSIGSIFLWFSLYAFAYKFRAGFHGKIIDLSSNVYSVIKPPYADKLFYLIVVLVVASLIISAIKKIRDIAFYSFHITASVFIMLVLLAVISAVRIPSNIAEQYREVLVKYYQSNLMGYLLVFILLTFLNVATILWKSKLASIGFKGIFHTLGAGFVAFMAVIVFNPFHLTNLTHTFVISVSKHAERWRQIHEWQSAFDWSNPVGTAVPYLVMFILAWMVLLLWIFFMILTSMAISQQSKRKVKNSEVFQWAKIDLPLMLIVALTIYMAVRSRRFIPIAAIAGCPIIALLIDQVARAVSAMLNFRKTNSIIVPSMPRYLEKSFIFAGIVAVLFFGTWWGLKFKRIYLNPWPNDPKYSSVFMRMTASDAKPFYAMKFIRDNKLSGKMLNYWTEGGFIAWGQDPDPNTGRTPLQLFMDGRAQAAYNRRAFDGWSYIMSGGQITYDIMQRTGLRGQEPTTEDYRAIGKWMDQQLTSRDVWLVLMPSAVYNDPERNNYYHATRGIENDPNWPLVFFNNKQKIFVNVKTPRGRELFDGIFTGGTIYPDQFHQNLIRAHSWLLYYRDQDKRKEGLKYAIDAFNAKPSQTPMLEIILLAARFAELQSNIDDFCADYARRFEENKDSWPRQDGYRQRVEAARLACFHM